MRITVLEVLVSLALLAVCSVALAQVGPPIEAEMKKAELNFPVTFLRAKRSGKHPEVFKPLRFEPGTQLWIRDPDGTERMLVDPGPDAAVVDPSVSIDGTRILYSLATQLSRSNRQRNDMPRDNIDGYEYDLTTGNSRRIIDASKLFRPNTSWGEWCPDPGAWKAAHGGICPGYGVYVLGMQELPGGDIAFSSNLNGYVPSAKYTFPGMQIHRYRRSDGDVQNITPLALSSALHPVLHADGERLLFSLSDTQGARDPRVWALWEILTDGRAWDPVWSGYSRVRAKHFHTSTSSGDICSIDYYNLNNFGFGALICAPDKKSFAPPHFGSPTAAENPGYAVLCERHINTPGGVRIQEPFEPVNQRNVTPFAIPATVARARTSKTDTSGKCHTLRLRRAICCWRRGAGLSLATG